MVTRWDEMSYMQYASKSQHDRLVDEYCTDECYNEDCNIYIDDIDFEELNEED